jgi:hypothetical protein
MTRACASARGSPVSRVLAAATIPSVRQHLNIFVISGFGYRFAYRVMSKSTSFMSSSVNRGPHPHVPQNRRHHARGEFSRGGMTTAAVRAIAQFALHAHGVRIVAVRDRGTGCVILAGRPFGLGQQGMGQRQSERTDQNCNSRLHCAPTRPSGIRNR